MKENHNNNGRMIHAFEHFPRSQPLAFIKRVFLVNTDFITFENLISVVTKKNAVVVRCPNKSQFLLRAFNSPEKFEKDVAKFVACSCERNFSSFGWICIQRGHNEDL